MKNNYDVDDKPFSQMVLERLNYIENWIEKHDLKEKEEVDNMLEDLAKEWENRKLPSDGGLSEL